MALSDEDRELISASIDGEISATEQTRVDELLMQPDAKEYRNSLVDTVTLLKEHGRASAPDGFSEIVRGQLARKRGRVVNLWMGPAMAAAAAIVVTFGLLYVDPWGFRTSGGETVGPTPDVSRIEGGLKHYPKPEIGKSSMEAAKERGTIHKLEGLPDIGELVGKDDMMPAGGLPAPEDDLASRLPDSDRPREGMVTDKTGKAKDAPVVVARDNRLSTAPRSINIGRGRAEPVVVSLEVNRNLDGAAQFAYNDVTMIGGLYGDLTGPEDEGFEAEMAVSNGFPATAHDFTLFGDIEIEIDESDLPELLSALRQVCSDQSYGTLVLPTDLSGRIAEEEKLHREIIQRGAAADSDRDHDAEAEGETMGPAEGPYRYLPREMLDRRNNSANAPERENRARPAAKSSRSANGLRGPQTAPVEEAPPVEEDDPSQEPGPRLRVRIILR